MPSLSSGGRRVRSKGIAAATDEFRSECTTGAFSIRCATSLSIGSPDIRKSRNSPVERGQTRLKRGWRQVGKPWMVSPGRGRDMPNVPDDLVVGRLAKHLLHGLGNRQVAANIA